MKNRALVLLTVILSGCYTTKVYTPAPAFGPEHRDRQWFTLGGLVPLSSATGEECPNGVSRAESELGAVDVLINIGLALGGGLAGAAICSKSDADQSACGTLGASLLPFLLATRTVQYTCARPGSAGRATAPARSASGAAGSAQGERREWLGESARDTARLAPANAEVGTADSR